jgi:hypothetical protein
MRTEPFEPLSSVVVDFLLKGPKSDKKRWIDHLYEPQSLSTLRQKDYFLACLVLGPRGQTNFQYNLSGYKFNAII